MANTSGTVARELPVAQRMWLRAGCGASSTGAVACPLIKVFDSTIGGPPCRSTSIWTLTIFDLGLYGIAIAERTWHDSKVVEICSFPSVISKLPDSALGTATPCYNKRIASIYELQCSALRGRLHPQPHRQCANERAKYQEQKGFPHGRILLPRAMAAKQWVASSPSAPKQFLLVITPRNRATGSGWKIHPVELTGSGTSLRPRRATAGPSGRGGYSPHPLPRVRMGSRETPFGGTNDDLNRIWFSGQSYWDWPLGHPNDSGKSFDVYVPFYSSDQTSLRDRYPLDRGQRTLMHLHTNTGQRIL